MHQPRKPLSRRHFLRGAGASIALPLLGAMTPTLGAGAADRAKPIPRTVAICGGLGFHAPLLFPEQPGRDYELTPYLKSPPRTSPRHDRLFGTVASRTERQQRARVELDLADFGPAPRTGRVQEHDLAGSIDCRLIWAVLRGCRTWRCPTTARSLAWTANGINIPSEKSPARLFQTLFVDGTEQEVAAQMRDLRRGRSILDTVLGDARRLDRSLGQRDRQKLGEYFTAIRDLEQRIGQSEQWTVKPKPKSITNRLRTLPTSKTSSRDSG